LDEETGISTVYFNYNGNCYYVDYDSLNSKQLIDDDDNKIILESVDFEYISCDECCNPDCNFKIDTVSGGDEGYNRVYYIGNRDCIKIDYNTFDFKDQLIVTNYDTGEILFDSECVGTNNWQSIEIDAIGITYLSFTVVPGCAGEENTLWKFKAECCIESSSSSSLSLSPILWRFTVTSDIQSSSTIFGRTCDAINNYVGGPGDFHITCGDISRYIRTSTYILSVKPSQHRDQIDTYFGSNFIWIPGIGNHELDNPNESVIEWLRNEYLYANGSPHRYALGDPSVGLMACCGPSGSEETTYEFEWKGITFLMLNEYWDPGNPSALYSEDAATIQADIVPELNDWIQERFETISNPVVVCGHAPAFPKNKYYGQSLDHSIKHRNNFWDSLEKKEALVYFCGHTHYYSKMQASNSESGWTGGNGSVWQIDCGSGGDPIAGEGITFINVKVRAETMEFEVWRDANSTQNWVLADSWFVDLKVS